MMHPFMFQTQLNIKRLILRNIKSIIFGLIFPIFFYVLYTKIFTMPMALEALKVWQVDYMLSMMIYGILITGITNVSTSLQQDHQNKFDLFVELSPSPKWQYQLSVILSYCGFYMLLIGILGLCAYVVNGVTLGVMEWLGMVLILLILVIPFSLIGVAISLAGNSSAVNILGNLCSFPLAIVGGLWWPLEMMPSWIVNIGKQLPTNQGLILIKEWVHEQSINVPALIGIGLWILLLIGIIVIIQVMIKQKESYVI